MHIASDMDEIGERGVVVLLSVKHRGFEYPIQKQYVLFVGFYKTLCY